METSKHKFNNIRTLPEMWVFLSIAIKATININNFAVAIVRNVTSDAQWKTEEYENPKQNHANSVSSTANQKTVAIIHKLKASIDAQGILI